MDVLRRLETTWPTALLAALSTLGIYVSTVVYTRIAGLRSY